MLLSHRVFAHVFGETMNKIASWFDTVRMIVMMDPTKRLSALYEDSPVEGCKITRAEIPDDPNVEVHDRDGCIAFKRLGLAFRDEIETIEIAFESRNGYPLRALGVIYSGTLTGAVWEDLMLCNTKHYGGQTLTKHLRGQFAGAVLLETEIYHATAKSDARLKGAEEVFVATAVTLTPPLIIPEGKIFPGFKIWVELKDQTKTFRGDFGIETSASQHTPGASFLATHSSGDWNALQIFCPRSPIEILDAMARSTQPPQIVMAMPSELWSGEDENEPDRDREDPNR